MLSFLMSMITGEVEFKYFILELCVIIFEWAFCLPVHESAHAWVADKLGDPTGRLKGRITLNPLAHLSLTGSLLVLLFGFGYAKPVPVNIRNFKKRKQYFALTSLAGPLSNLLLAVIFGFLSNLFLFICNRNGLTEESLVYAAMWFFYNVAYINVAVAVFNMIPFPPLDGSRLVSMVLPDNLYYKLLSYERYLMYVFFAIIFICNRAGFSPISYISEFIFGLIEKLTDIPFVLIG